MKLDKRSGYLAVPPSAMRRLLMIANWLLSVVVASDLWIHFHTNGVATSLAESLGLGGLILLLRNSIPIGSHAERSTPTITPDTVEEWLPAALCGSGYGVTISDAQRRLVWVNDSFTRMTGYRVDEVVGRKTSDLLYFDGTDAGTVHYVRKAFTEVRGIRFEIRVRSNDGREWWLDTDAQPLLDPRGTLQGWACIQTDVTNEVHKREAMRRDQHRILMMIQGGDIGTWEWDATTNLIEPNSVFLGALGYANDQEARTLKWLRDLYHEDDRDNNLRGLEEVIAGRTDLYRGQQRLRMKDGGWK